MTVVSVAAGLLSALGAQGLRGVMTGAIAVAAHPAVVAASSAVDAHGRLTKLPAPIRMRQ